MFHRHAAVAAAAAVLALSAAAPASAAPSAPPDPVVNWISPVTGQDMRSLETRRAMERAQHPAPVSTPTPAGGADAPFLPAAPLALAAALALAALGTGVHRHRAVRPTPAQGA